MKPVYRITQQARLFLITESALYAAFLLCDALGVRDTGTALKYLSLLLCLFYVLRRGASADGRLVSWALFLTACADFFLLVWDRFYTAGVAFFCLVQMLYAVRLHRMTPPEIRRPVRRALALYGAVSAACFAAVCAAGYLMPLTALVCVYFPRLLCNAVESLRGAPTFEGHLFSAGLWLFLACDICVGLHHTGALAGRAAWWVGMGMWIFYLPSQVLIALSVSQRRTP